MNAHQQQSFDVYRNKAKPSLRIAVTPGASLPPQFQNNTWTLIKEPSMLHSDVTKDIAVKGYCYFQVVKG
jgi:hypothetical protein